MCVEQRQQQQVLPTLESRVVIGIILSPMWGLHIVTKLTIFSSFIGTFVGRHGLKKAKPSRPELEFRVRVRLAAGNCWNSSPEWNDDNKFFLVVGQVRKLERPTSGDRTSKSWVLHWAMLDPWTRWNGLDASAPSNKPHFYFFYFGSNLFCSTVISTAASEAVDPSDDDGIDSNDTDDDDDDNQLCQKWSPQSEAELVSSPALP